MGKMVCFFLFWTVFSLLQISCGSRASAPLPEAGSVDSSLVSPVIHGRVFSGIYRNTDSFFCFFPAGWETGKSPAVIFLDPHGDALLPIEKYRSLAGETGIALISAPQIKNHIPFAQAKDACAALIQTLHERYRPAHIYLAGFSGGAKIALLEGNDNPLIHRVIYSGSGLTFDCKDRSKPFFGIAGKRDMNYTELIELHNAMLSGGLTSVLVEWNGKHEWPSAQTMRLAFTPDLSELPPGSWFTDSEEQRNKRNQEQKLKQFYLKALTTQDLNWWAQEVSRLHRNMATDPDGMMERVNGYLSLACYSFSKRLLDAHETGQVYPILSIYRMVDPENADAACFLARYYWMLNQTEQAAKMINEARELGFKQWESVEPGLKALLKP